MTNEEIVEKLKAKFDTQVFDFDTTYGMLTFYSAADLNLKIMQYMFDELGFTFLTDLTGVHFPDELGKEFCIVYLLQNIKQKIRVRYKVSVSKETPQVYTATRIYSTADWLERECYDFFGIEFVGHPNLKRIMNADEMNYFPLRKEYPLEDQTRIDKDDEMFGRDRKILN